MTGWRTFLVVWVGQVVSVFGSGLTSFALGVWLFQRTGSETQFAINFMCIVLPRVLLGSLGGVLADRWDRRVAMIVGDSGAACGTLAVAVLLFANQLQPWHIYLATAISSAFGTIQRPAQSAAVAMLIPKDQLGRVSGLRRVTGSAADLLSPVLAGYLVITIGIERVILIDMATFVVAVGMLLSVRFPRVPASAHNAESSMWREVLDGWRYITQHPDCAACC